mgnify:CR=1 FL=1
MQILKTISDKDLGLDFKTPDSYKARTAVRIALFHNDKIALLHSKKYDFHKLGGGGVENGEDLIVALKRESLEELGCNIKDIKEFGIIEEYRNDSTVHQMSNYFIASLDGEVGKNNLQGYEIDHDYEVVWFTVNEALSILEKEFTHYKESGSLSGKFTLYRDIFVLKELEKQNLC